MRAALLVPVLALAACTQPAAPPDDRPPAPPAGDETPDGDRIVEGGFDADAWIDAVRAAETDAERVALSEALLDAVDWRTACGEDDPTAERRGVVQVHDVDAASTLAEVTCQAFAYQSAFALVDARGGRPPRLVRALGVDEDGTVSADTTASFFGLFSSADAAGTFDVLTKSAGHGGCGLDVRYRLRRDGGAAIERVRAHPDCDDPRPPEDWPVTVP